MSNSDKLQNVVKLLSSLGVNIKKTKSRLDIINTLPATTPVRKNLNSLLAIDKGKRVWDINPREIASK